MKEKVERKKDEGFTLIELMIVIAVIGILAIVLIPKVGTIKTQARTSGLDANLRMVQGYVQSRISSWNNNPDINAGGVAQEVYNALVTKPGSDDSMKNPYDAGTAALKGTDGGDGSAESVAGEVYLTSSGSPTINQVKITAMGSDGKTVYKTITITP